MSAHRHLDSNIADAKMRTMRTTVTLDPDVEARLRQVMRERDLSFKEALNTAIRMGLQAHRAGPKPFKQRTYPMGLREGVNLTKALQLAADLEDEAIIRKMELRK
jgi:hypothetical protein